MSEGVRISAADLGQLVIRLGIGGMFVFVHGWQKVMAGPKLWEKLGGAMVFPKLWEWLGEHTGFLGAHFWPTFWGFMAMSAEFGGGILFLLGVLFRPGCALLAFTMVMATITMLHGPQGLSSASHPIMAGAAILGLLLMGPGKISLKHAIGPLRSRWYG